MSSLAEALIAECEGRNRCVYRDTRGFASIGIGCLVDPKVPGAGLCDAAIEAQFAHDSEHARTVASEFPHYAEMNEVRQAVLVSLAFQLGTKPLHWPNFMAALEAKDFTAAAAAGRDTDWWRAQTPARAEREMVMLASGNWAVQT